MINDLIDKHDNVEVVRDQIAFILATELQRQRQLAVVAGKNPDDWHLRIFTERSNPWEAWLNQHSDLRPMVNVWFDHANYDERASNSVERQKTEGVFHLDCYGCGVSADTPDGHSPGDREAAFAVQRALRLVRNILMAGEYTYLGLRGVVWRRWPQSVSVYQPEMNGQSIQAIVGARLALHVIFNEFSPQVDGPPIETIAIEGRRQSNGEIIVDALYDLST